METEVTDEGKCVKIAVSDGDSRAEAVVIGLSKSEVENRLDELISAHGLDSV